MHLSRKDLSLLVAASVLSQGAIASPVSGSSCSATLTTALKTAFAPSDVAFCNFWLTFGSTAQTTSPISALSTQGLSLACTCDGGKAASKVALSSKLSLPTVKSCPATQVAAVKKAFANPTAFCKYYMSLEGTWTKYSSPAIAGLTSSALTTLETYEACDCILNNLPLIAATITTTTTTKKSTTTTTTTITKKSTTTTTTNTASATAPKAATTTTRPSSTEGSQSHPGVPSIGASSFKSGLPLSVPGLPVTIPSQPSTSPRAGSPASIPSNSAAPTPVSFCASKAASLLGADPLAIPFCQSILKYTVSTTMVMTSSTPTVTVTPLITNAAGAQKATVTKLFQPTATVSVYATVCAGSGHAKRQVVSSNTPIATPAYLSGMSGSDATSACDCHRPTVMPIVTSTLTTVMPAVTVTYKPSATSAAVSQPQTAAQTVTVTSLGSTTTTITTTITSVAGAFATPTQLMEPRFNDFYELYTGVSLVSSLATKFKIGSCPCGSAGSACQIQSPDGVSFAAGTCTGSAGCLDMCSMFNANSDGGSGYCVATQWSASAQTCTLFSGTQLPFDQGNYCANPTSDLSQFGVLMQSARVH
ncbi:hypothetical protein K461DRAFT_276153 [Myriangium duriaei CBS 260.36]|uniref:Uncharacterized protein n=1 Tax=Myriangium duriaei CBS 260.36 TaxID=1168546 RepID=A0A9P4MPU1_9PEZI|nr:hypothetical protein K461DRAFT_276153 [Myriangium duriaei CBS 260.36]